MKRNNINENQFIQVIEQTVRNMMNEAYDRKELESQIAQEVLGTSTFEDFYKNTGFWVGSRDYALMQEYFRRLKEATQEMENKH